MLRCPLRWVWQRRWRQGARMCRACAAQNQSHLNERIGHLKFVRHAWPSGNLFLEESVSNSPRPRSWPTLPMVVPCPRPAVDLPVEARAFFASRAMQSCALTLLPASSKKSWSSCHRRYLGVLLFLRLLSALGQWRCIVEEAARPEVEGPFEAGTLFALREVPDFF